MSGWTIYHNPKCVTSRKALALLRERGIEPEVIEYLKAPPGSAGLKALLGKLGMSAAQLLRRREALYKQLKLEGAGDAEAFTAMIEHPVLMERPVVVRGGKAVLARPPEKALELI